MGSPASFWQKEWSVVVELVGQQWKPVNNDGKLVIYRCMWLPLSAAVYTNWIILTLILLVVVAANMGVREFCRSVLTNKFRTKQFPSIVQFSDGEARFKMNC
ncbi:hypothetical protein BDV24DRAFT_145921 [Aspergillus arachidicola]|uniref:Uncharacterized protein n=1 Tax=Aspergillus arachidicola TaxID=656916 RepID=A0A5N6XPY8_9EURO|nr:hypothetical protein BDV24DRAFT_145921 [Aspergillus arachidicola]